MLSSTNLLFNTDSYKASHWLQYPPGTEATFFYLESRGRVYERTQFFGLQSILKEYLGKPVTTAMIDQARAFFPEHGKPFNEAGWRHIVKAHDGRLPAIPSGLH